MAADFLMLKRYPHPERVRFRAYGWTRPAVTFGYSQKIAWVRGQLAGWSERGEVEERPADVWELCRRPTGGGVVDHRKDWTYALVIPRGHPWEEMRAMDSYRAVHTALREALAMEGVETELKVSCEKGEGESCVSQGKGLAVCFARAELFDLIDSATGRKVAGAAQKRTKQGLLVQGSVDRGGGGSEFNDESMALAMGGILAQAMDAEWEETPWPDFSEGEWEGLSEWYASPDWVAYR